MKNNDLSDAPMQRVMVVFEGAVAFLAKEDEKLFGRLMDKKHYAAALQLFRLNDLAVKVISDRVWRHGMRIDLVTFLGPQAWADSIFAAMEAEVLPINAVTATRPDVLARTISWTPGLARVYDPFPEHLGLYGPKGCYLSDINMIGRA